MKQKDIAVLAVVAIIAVVISSIAAKALFSSPKDHKEKVPVVEPISGTFPDVKNDSQYKTIFNDKALDPTQLIKIPENQSPQPFKNDQQ